jgi:hypothetical protein
MISIFSDSSMPEDCVGIQWCQHDQGDIARGEDTEVLDRDFDFNQLAPADNSLAR